MIEMIEYLKIHLISLNQDLDSLKNEVSINDYVDYPSEEYYEGSINATAHLLSVANDILEKTKGN